MDIKEIAKQLGSRGGLARASKLSKERRVEIATRASHSRKSYLSGKRVEASTPVLTAKITTECVVDHMGFCSAHRKRVFWCNEEKKKATQ